MSSKSFLSCCDSAPKFSGWSRILALHLLSSPAIASSRSSPAFVRCVNEQEPGRHELQRITHSKPQDAGPNCIRSQSQPLLHAPSPNLLPSPSIRRICIPKLFLRQRIPLGPRPPLPQRRRIRIHVPNACIRTRIQLMRLTALQRQALKPPLARAAALHMYIQACRRQRRHEPQQREAEQRFVRPAHALSEFVFPRRGRAGGR